VQTIKFQHGSFCDIKVHKVELYENFTSQYVNARVVNIAVLQHLLKYVSSSALSSAILLFSSTAYGTAILFGPYFCNTQLQQFSPGQILAQ